MLGREDIGAAYRGADEYRPSTCPSATPAVEGLEAVLDEITARARDTRVVIVNESHYVTRHRDFSRRLIERLSPLGYTVFAAEDFVNIDGAPDPVKLLEGKSWIPTDIGYYIADPSFGALVGRARALGFRLAAYEQVHIPTQIRDTDRNRSIALRESAQAANLAAILAEMGDEEKLVVHVGYSLARESVEFEEDGFETAWMAARLARLTGIDPLTIAQTVCRGSGPTTRLSMPEGYYAGFSDLIVDHPVTDFVHRRAAWRFDGKQAVAIPQPFVGSAEPLVVEAFREGEPFDAVPEDRVYFEPGEDVRLALPPGRYVVRAVRLSE